MFEVLKIGNKYQISLFYLFVMQREKEAIGKSDCLAVAEVNTSLLTHRQNPLNSGTRC